MPLTRAYTIISYIERVEVVMKKAYIVAMSSMDVIGSCAAESTSNFNAGLGPHAIDGMFHMDSMQLVKPDIVPTAFWSHWERINQIGAIVVDKLLDGITLPEDTAVVFSTQTDGLGNLVAMQEGQKIPPRRLLSNGRDFLVGYISKLYGLKGPATSLAAACATGLYNLDYGMRLLDDREFVIVGTSDSGTNFLSMDYFRRLGAIGTDSKPFDKSRDGFIMGEGGAAIVICREETLEKHNLTPIAVIHDVQLTNDGDTGSLTNPGDGGLRAMKQLNANRDDLAFVKAHGTSTPIGDPNEVDQIVELYGDVPIVSFKSLLGHTIGTSGLLEMIHAIMHINKGKVPANQKLTDSINPNCITESQETDKKVFVNNAFGFGGKCASALVEVL